MYILRLILLKFYFLTIIGLLADLDLPDFGALVTGPKSALNSLTNLQLWKRTLNYYHKQYIRRHKYLLCKAQV